MAKFLFCYFTLILMLELHYENVGTEADCNSQVHSDCLHNYNYTDQDLKTVLDFFIKTFKPYTNRTACTQLYVRKDFKCLTETEKALFVDVFLNLSANGVITNLTRIHDIYWSMGHKTNEGLQFHRWFLLVFETIARQTLAFENFTLPYWEFYQEAYAPEKSIVWDILGRPNNGSTGSNVTDYCIATGPFANLTVYYPYTHCLKRQWEPNGTIRPWEPAEWATSIIQQGITLEVLIPILIAVLNIVIQKIVLDPQRIIPSIPALVKVIAELLKSFANPTVQPYLQFGILLGFIAHFITHLSLGGMAGDLSTGYGTQDPAFYLFHNDQADKTILKWQLSKPENYVPSSYTEGGKLVGVPAYTFYFADLDTDVLTYFTDVTIKDTFTFGYGKMCYVHDQLIKPIVDLVQNNYQSIYINQTSLTAYKRLKDSLTPAMLAKYFPRFATNTATFFDHVLPNVGPECNTQPNKIRYWDYFNDTLNGRTHAVARFMTDGNVSLYPLPILNCEKFAHCFRDVLNNSPYYSPYSL